MKTKIKSNEVVYILAKTYLVARLYAKKAGIFKFHYVSNSYVIEGLDSGRFICVEGYSENQNYQKIDRTLNILIHVYKVKREFVSL